MFTYRVRFSPIGQNPYCCDANAEGIWGAVVLPATHPDEFTSSRKADGETIVVVIRRYARLPWTMLHDQRGIVAFAFKVAPFSEFGMEEGCRSRGLV